VAFATLMVRLELGHSNANLLKIVDNLAERFHADVIGIAACQPIETVYGDNYLAGAFVEQDREEIEKEIKAAEAEFRNALCACAGNLEWRATVTFAPLSESVAQEARGADLLITGADSGRPLLGGSRYLDTGDLVIRAGRPVLIVPAGVNELKLDRVVVGWKETREARRAAADALPFLRAAKRVTVAEIAGEEDQASARTHLDDVVRWLKQHDILAKPLVSVAKRDDAGELGEITRELGADLVVADAYGHSRMREWALGGVTRDLLLCAERGSLVSH
jgi:nucleotide-binding universal stress UspA family protein